VNKQRELVRVVRHDRKEETRDIKQLIRRQLAFEDGPDGEPARRATAECTSSGCACCSKRTCCCAWASSRLQRGLHHERPGSLSERKGHSASLLAHAGGLPQAAAVADCKCDARLSKLMVTCFAGDQVGPTPYPVHEMVLPTSSSPSSPDMANRWTEGPSTVDAANCQYQEQLALENRFLTKTWGMRVHTLVLSVVALNVFHGWTRVVESEGMLKPGIPLLGMQLIQRGRRQLHHLCSHALAGAVVRGRGPQFVSSPETAVRSLGTNTHRHQFV